MSELEPPKIFKCQINHEGEKTELSCWTPAKEVAKAASVLIIHDIAETVNSYTSGIKSLIDEGFKVYGFNLKCFNFDENIERKDFPDNFKDFTVEILQVIAYIKHIEGGVPPFVLTQGLGSLVGLINTRKHANFVRGFIACSPMFQLSEKIIPLKRLTIKTLSDFTPNFVLPKKISPKFTSNRKAIVDGNAHKIEPKITAREAYEYLKAMSQARKNFAKISRPTLLVCPDHNAVHKYSFLKKSISKHKYEDSIEFINLHTKYHAIASDRSTVLETYEKYIIPWLNSTLEKELIPKVDEAPETSERQGN